MIYRVVITLSSFKQWITENSGAPGGLEPPKQHPEAMPGAWSDYHAPGSEELPPTKRTNYKMKKKSKKN